MVTGIAGQFGGFQGAMVFAWESQHGRDMLATGTYGGDESPRRLASLWDADWAGRRR
jgi:uncharacterized protein YndB with AHSA1/START domain